MHCRKYIYSGDVLEIEEYIAARPSGKQAPRGSKENLTTAQQQEQNLRNARKWLTRKINANFGRGDIFATLTYKGNQPSDEQAIKDRSNFFRRSQTLCHRSGKKNPKYIGVTEGMEQSPDHRVHHHVIISGLEAEEIRKLWKNGKVILSWLDPEEDYTGLAHYITKDTGIGPHKKKWCQSKGLKKPKIVKKIIKSDHGRPIKVPKGYKVIVQEMYASERTGKMQYIRAIRIGGMDYATGKGTG
ncbi:MAG: hypothetical protein ABF449_00665 [Ethanoligenens sp.]